MEYGSNSFIADNDEFGQSGAQMLAEESKKAFVDGLVELRHGLDRIIEGEEKEYNG